MTFNGLQSVKFLIEVNFYLSVIVLIAGGFLSVSGSYSVFEFNEDLYGALDNNLRMIMVYLAMTEVVILGYCFFRKNFQVMVPVGFFLILMIGSMEFYGDVNTIEIDKSFPLFFLYTGFFLILMIGSMEFYGDVNTIEIDKSFPLFFLYTGLSHILFGVMAGIEKNRSSEYNEKSSKLKDKL